MNKEELDYQANSNFDIRARFVFFKTYLESEYGIDCLDNFIVVKTDKKSQLNYIANLSFHDFYEDIKEIQKEDLIALKYTLKNNINFNSKTIPTMELKVSTFSLILSVLAFFTSCIAFIESNIIPFVLGITGIVFTFQMFRFLKILFNQYEITPKINLYNIFYETILNAVERRLEELQGP